MMISVNLPKVLALDFDGVICDGLDEYFETTRQTYCQIWGRGQDLCDRNGMDVDPSPPLLQRGDEPQLEQWRSRFYSLRPVIETGWEMAILLRALVLGVTDEEIMGNWSDIVARITSEDGISRPAMIAEFDGVRDRAIASNLDAWLSLHRFYPGVISRLQEILASETELYIVTTKEGRFVQRLLQENGVNLARSAILGKECQRPKRETLAELLKVHQIRPHQLWFVEDLLKTLESVQKYADLSGIGLYLADWGYNTDAARSRITPESGIKLLSLAQFCQHFREW